MVSFRLDLCPGRHSASAQAMLCAYLKQLVAVEDRMLDSRQLTLSIHLSITPTRVPIVNHLSALLTQICVSSPSYSVLFLYL